VTPKKVIPTSEAVEVKTLSFAPDVKDANVRFAVLGTPRRHFAKPELCEPAYRLLTTGTSESARHLALER